MTEKLHEPLFKLHELDLSSGLVNRKFDLRNAYLIEGREVLLDAAKRYSSIGDWFAVAVLTELAHEDVTGVSR